MGILYFLRVPCGTRKRAFARFSPKSFVYYTIFYPICEQNILLSIYLCLILTTFIFLYK